MTETQPVINPDTITPLGADYNPPVDPSSSSTSHVLPIIISSLVTVLVLVGGYFVFMSKSPKNIVLNSTPSPTIELASPSSLTDPTTNWKTYTNDKYNFSFQYPLDASLYDSVNQVGDRIIIQNYSKNSLPKSESSDFQLVVFLGDAISDKLDSYPKVWEKELGKRPTELLTVGGLDAIRGYSGQKQEAIPTVWIIKGKYLLTIQLSTPTSSNKKYFDQILSTFKFTTSTSLPTGWTYQSTELCNSSIAMPPVIIDKDNRKWVVEKGEDQPFGLWKGQSYRVIHRNPEEASGFMSGMVSLSCGTTSMGSNSDKLVSELRQYLEAEKSNNDNSEYIIQIQSTKDIVKWGNPVKEITFTGGMYDSNQKYYLFTKNTNWFLITSKSDSTYPIINQQTEQIMNLLKFE